jgi:NO-binding membrane sensor protein with MHYT domain
VVESVAIAVVAATVALWLTLTVNRPLVIIAAALIMGVAVNGMHFTGMSAMSVYEHQGLETPTGASRHDAPAADRSGRWCSAFSVWCTR